MHIFHSIRFNLVLLAVLGILPMLVIFILIGIERRANEIEHAEHTAFRLAESYAFTENQELKRIKTVLANLSQSPVVQSLDEAACNELFRKYLQANPTYANFAMMDTKGFAMSSALPFKKPKDLSNRKEVKGALATGLFSIGEVSIGRVSKLQILPVAYPVRNDRGELISVLIAALKLQGLETLFQHTNLPSGSFVGLIDHRGNRLFRYPLDGRKIGTPIPATIFKRITEIKKSGMFSAMSGGGVDMVFAVRRLAGSNDQDPYLDIIVGMPREVLIEEVDDDTFSYIVLSGVAFVFSICLALLIGHSLIHTKMLDLVAVTERLKLGDLKARSELSYSTGEFGQLSHSINSMADALEKEVETNAKAEQEVQDLRNYLSNIIDSMPSVIIGVTSDGVVTQWNLKAENDLGLSKDDVLGKRIEEVSPCLAAEMEKVRVAIHSRTVQAENKHVRIENGETIYEDITVYPLIANGVQGAVIRIDDVTDRANLEHMLVQSEKMMSVGGLAAGMAHEINNPLSGILGNVYNLNKRLLTAMDSNRQAANECGIELEQVQKYLEKRKIPKMIEAIRDSGSRAASIVNNMLSFSRKSNKKMEPFHLPFLMDKTLELVANDYDLKKWYDFKQIEIVREYEEDMPNVLCEGNEMQQVFLNLFKNGAEAMVEKDYGMESPRFYCRIYRQANMAVMEIEDNGPGIDESTVARVFEPFYTTKAVGKGTGLGLSVSYFIITDQHKGIMSVESSVGKGTKFTIKIPLQV
ncbi:ATP-binding protein [Maridesulfovibrio zosterae]|uniref:ATP-binding protein n=1 Tax=Maridesulfovibrio zosterae TaxID=82171 RepID=UPI00042592D6|nr:ATP-binding protein [Maridesulfovibrio zosterae]